MQSIFSSRCIFFLLAIPLSASAQTGEGPVRVATVPGSSEVMRIYVDDVNGRPFQFNTQGNLQGSFFLSEQWNKGTVRLRDGRIVTDVHLKFNLYNNELYFERKAEMMAFADTVLQFSFSYNTDEGVKQAMYRSGFPAFEGKTANNFYEVLTDGKLQLLRYRYRYIKETHPYNQPVQRELADEHFLVLYDAASGAMVKLKKDLQPVLKALPEKAARLQQLASEKKLRFKQEADWAELVKAMNAE
jgi:hypothetical protein